MSTRTVIEINHDFLRDLDEPQTFAALVAALHSGRVQAGVVGSQAIKILGQRHHTEPEWVQGDEKWFDGYKRWEMFKANQGMPDEWIEEFCLCDKAPTPEDYDKGMDKLIEKMYKAYDNQHLKG